MVEHVLLPRVMRMHSTTIPATTIPATALTGRRRFAGIAALGLLLTASPIVAGPVTAQLASLVGTYNGGQMEMVAGLQLRADGRFNYALSYGALDETATGRWTL